MKFFSKEWETFSESIMRGAIEEMEGWGGDNPNDPERRYEDFYDQRENLLSPVETEKRIGIANVTKTFTFNIPEVKELIADYLRRVEGVGIDPTEIRVDVQAHVYDGPFYSSPQRATFSVDVKGN
jgi:hypothetical protein